MRFASGNIEKSGNPGPASYTFSAIRQAPASFKFSKALKNMQEGNSRLGPGYYNVAKKELSSEGGYVGVSPRMSNRQEELPGPGNYQDVSLDVFKHKEASYV